LRVQNARTAKKSVNCIGKSHDHCFEVKFPWSVDNRLNELHPVPKNDPKSLKKNSFYREKLQTEKFLPEITFIESTQLMMLEDLFIVISCLKFDTSENVFRNPSLLSAYFTA
jgi:hypothetical protein